MCEIVKIMDHHDHDIYLYNYNYNVYLAVCRPAPFFCMMTQVTEKQKNRLVIASFDFINKTS